VKKETAGISDSGFFLKMKKEEFSQPKQFAAGFRYEKQNF